MTKNLFSEKGMSVRWAMITPRKARENGTNWRSDCFSLSSCAGAGALLSGRNVGGRTIVLFLWWFSLFLLYYCMHECYMHVSWFNSVELTFYLLYYICNLSSLSGLWGDICMFFLILFSVMIYHRNDEYISLCRKAPFSPHSLQECSWFTVLY